MLMKSYISYIDLIPYLVAQVHVLRISDNRGVTTKYLPTYITPGHRTHISVYHNVFRVRIESLWRMTLYHSRMYHRANHFTLVEIT